MLPNPLHPAVVHFPIVLMLLLPLAVAMGLWAIRRGAAPARAWVVPVVAAAALTASSWLAVETGERDEEKVEQAVAEASLHDHEEAAERFLVLSAALLALTAAGLARGAAGRVARFGAAAGALGLVAFGVQVGHSGGNLVYRDGAASAYTTDLPAGVAAREEGGREGPARGEDDD